MHAHKACTLHACMLAQDVYRFYLVNGTIIAVCFTIYFGITSVIKKLKLI